MWRYLGDKVVFFHREGRCNHHCVPVNRNLTLPDFWSASSYKQIEPEELETEVGAYLRQRSRKTYFLSHCTRSIRVRFAQSLPLKKCEVVGNSVSHVNSGDTSGEVVQSVALELPNNVQKDCTQIDQWKCNRLTTHRRVFFLRHTVGA